MEIARWWTSATQESRFELYRRSVEGDAQAPPLAELRLGIFIAETEAGEVDWQGRALGF